MSRLTLHTLESAPSDSRPFVEKAIANNGFLPNLIGVLANSPQALETYLTVSGINAKTSLTLAEREVVQITAARIHGCDFCVAGHTAVALKKAQLPVEQVRALQQGGATGDVKLDAVAQFAQAVSSACPVVASTKLIGGLWRFAIKLTGQFHRSLATLADNKLVSYTFLF